MFISMRIPYGFEDGSSEREEWNVLFVERPVPRSERHGQDHLREGRHEIHQPKHPKHVEQLKSGDEILRHSAVVRTLGQFAHGFGLVVFAVPLPFGLGTPIAVLETKRTRF